MMRWKEIFDWNDFHNFPMLKSFKTISRDNDAGYSWYYPKKQTLIRELWLVCANQQEVLNHLSCVAVVAHRKTSTQERVLKHTHKYACVTTVTVAGGGPGPRCATR